MSPEERVIFIKTVVSNQKLNGKSLEITLHKPYVALGKISYFKKIKKNLIGEDEVLNIWCPWPDSRRTTAC